MSERCAARRAFARAALVVIVLGILAAMAVVRVEVQHRIWPIETFHPRLLVMALVLVTWMVVVVGLAVGAWLLLRTLFRWAEWEGGERDA